MIYQRQQYGSTTKQNKTKIKLNDDIKI